MKRRETGAMGEKMAAGFLCTRGYTILECNYRTRFGEIDIVAQDGDCLAFVEVRTKRNRNFGSPEESITAGKMEKMRLAAGHYLQYHDNVPETWRIDLVAIELDRTNRPTRMELFQNAVGE